MKVGYVYDPVYLKHDTGGHVENAQRVEAIIAHLEQTGLKQQLQLITPRAATEEELALVHTKRHIATIKDVAQKGGGWLEADTVLSSGSYEAAVHAAGGVIKATEAVVNGGVNSAFALVRPPGHHATANWAMGFCLFNNIAIAAKYAISQLGLKHIAIIDFDVHHGNGTQEAFEEDPQVMYLSTHESPFYPGTGGADEIGVGTARGTKVNIPLPAGCGDAEYVKVYEQIVVPVVRRLRPELIMVSAGYDAHWADGIALMQLSVAGFARMLEFIKGLADEFCGGRLVFTLEGGYNLKALSAAVKATFDVLLGNAEIEDPLGPSMRHFGVPSIDSLIKKIRSIHGLP